MWTKIKECMGRTKDFYKNNEESVNFLIVLFVSIYVWNWMQGWWVVNIEDINSYLNVKIPSSVIGCVFLPIIVWFFDIITPGSFLRKICEDSIASAIVLGSLALALGIMLSK